MELRGVSKLIITPKTNADNKDGIIGLPKYFNNSGEIKTTIEPNAPPIKLPKAPCYVARFQNFPIIAQTNIPLIMVAIILVI